MAAVVTKKTGPMTGEEMVAHTRWARQLPGASGATEDAICCSCRLPFLFSGRVPMPRTCGLERCMIAADERADLRVLSEGREAPPTAVAPPRTRRVRPAADDDGPICTCTCHAAANLAAYGLVSDTDAPDVCEHCGQIA